MNTLANALTEIELDRVCGGSGAELDMIGLQSLVSKRATSLQLTTGMLNAMGEASKAISKNIR